MKKVALLVAALLMGTGVNAFATPAQIRELRSEIAAIRAEMNQAQALKAKRCGKLDLNFSFTTVLQGMQREFLGDTSRNVGNYRLDVTAGKKLGERGKAFALFTVGEGTGLAPIGLTPINLTALDRPEFTVREVWYQHKLCKRSNAAVTFGKIDPSLHFDGNAAANNEVTQFMNYSFVVNAAIGFNASNLGLMAAISPLRWLEVSGGYFVSDAGFGMQFDRQLFGVAQINLTPLAGGNYRFMVWNNTSEETKAAQEGYGLALSFDQRIFNYITMFVRYGWAQQEYFAIESAFSGGVALAGNWWNRANDTVGLALGRIWASDPIGANGEKAETNTEFFYSLSLTNALTLTPSLQWVNTPVAGENNLDAFVYGLRANVRF